LKFSISSKDFKNIFAKGQSLKTGDLLFKYIESTSPQIGFVVSRKYGNAIQRNKFKRRCREIFYEKIKQGMKLQVVIIPKDKNIDYSEIKKSINSFLGESSRV
tara:strand:+ start:192 stop:500 length:309 start_codon:yes stop_codon:yes gene_type:complete